MRIDVAESLFDSWLRHAKKCEIVQTNWKASSNWEKKEEDKAKNLFDQFNTYFANKKDKILFGKQNFEQAIKQSEIDVIGICIKKNVKEKNEIYLIDVAFHAYGLDYGRNKQNTILKKILKMVLIGNMFFKDCKVNIIFASPIVRPKPLEMLEEDFNKITNYLKEKNIKHSLRLITNNKFMTEILEPTLNYLDDLNNENEIFLRSHKLFMSFGNFNIKQKISENSEENKKYIELISEGKIGSIVQKSLKDLFNSSLIDGEIINNLMDKDYSKETFDFAKPLLKEFKVDENIKTAIADNKGRYRYYKEIYSFNDKNYLVYSQLYETSKEKYLNWLKNILSI